MGLGFHILSPYVSATLKSARQVVIDIPIIKITRTMVLSVPNTIRIKEHITEIIARVFLTVFETDMVVSLNELLIKIYFVFSFAVLMLLFAVVMDFTSKNLIVEHLRSRFL